MARRKSKKKPQQEDTSMLLDPSVPQSKRRINSSASPALLFIVIFTVGASVMGWFCALQQHSLDQLSGSVTTVQRRITTLQQQVMEMTDARQTSLDLGVEERIFALEKAHKKAQERAEVALATSEKLKNSDLHSPLSVLHGEMDARLAEIKQVSLSVTTLQAMFKNQGEEFEAVKENVVATLSSRSELSENVAWLTNAVASVYSRAEKQVASVEALNAQLQGQASKLNELKESMHLCNVALHTNNQEMASIKELVKAKQAMRAQALEEMLSSVQMTLDEQFFTSQTLHSSVMAQLQTFHTQLANAPIWSTKLKSNKEGTAAEEFISSTAQNATEVEEKLEDVEGKAEQQDTEDEAEEEAIQEEQSLAQQVEGDVTEEQEKKEMTPEEQEDKDITGQVDEEQEVTEKTIDGHILNKSLEEEISEEVVDSWEELDELNSEVFMDENEEDE